MKPEIAFLLLAGLASGCTTTRMADLRDCGRLSIGAGAGLEAHAKFGCLLHPTLGIGSNTERAGLENRHRFGTWEETQVVWPVETLMQALGASFGGGTGVPFASYERFRTPEISADPEINGSWLPVFELANHQHPFTFGKLTDLELGATLVFVSVRAGINPLEILDYLGGFFGLDPAKDDAAPL